MNKKSIEEQAAQLTEQQKNTVLKVGKYATLAILGAAAPFIIVALFFLMSIIYAPTHESSEAATLFLYVFIALGVIAMVAVVVFIKVKFPYYSDKLAAYIKKQQKSNNS